ncbi:DUF2255 domain-containing protein [Chryseobacterium pennae]|uniref:DUF2255 domain-containing protein n=1 Tax=Chryseobacterium pennae TaxID=2258962 RepID=A0A3D9CCS9_9FLAO|nr:DUF2255 family protein [Chryseobacterium pennae]REC63665.1 DUF2255 domain-containing protein [Chryseobacterium pennae]
MNKNKALDYIKTNNLIGIKAGSERPDFLEIWMVVVQNRIFARSWGLAERSWYNTFLKSSVGQIKCDDEIYTIKAIVSEDIEQLTDKINRAYLTKYNFGRNRKYAMGIIEEKHIERTMEFIIDDVK